MDPLTEGGMESLSKEPACETILPTSNNVADFKTTRHSSLAQTSVGAVLAVLNSLAHT